MSNFKNIKSWVFDLDNTLYPASTNLFAQVDVKMREFISEHLNMEMDEAFKLQKKYFRESGTTLRGLMDHHNVNPKDYLAYVHNIDVSPISPSPDLYAALERLPGKKYIFTNGSVAHANNVMNRLGVTDIFDGIFDIVDAGYTPKPEPSIYDQFLSKFDINPHESIMFEDIARNLEPAADRGMQCVLVKTDTDWAEEGANGSFIHHETDDLVSWLNALDHEA